MTTLEIRIAELETIQNQEVENNYANGDLYNDCEDKLNMIRMYGQEEAPEFEEADEFTVINSQCK